MSYHLMLREDEPLCGGKDGLLTFREDVADCPACWREALNAAVKERTQEVTRLNDLLSRTVGPKALEELRTDLSTARQSLYEVVEQRNQAVAYAKKLEAGRTLTCVYCGHEYPPGSPSHGADVLTEHIKVCEKHPMRPLEKENRRLKKILRDLCVGHPDTCACRGCREAFAPKEGK